MLLLVQLSHTLFQDTQLPHQLNFPCRTLTNLGSFLRGNNNSSHNRVSSIFRSWRVSTTGVCNFDHLFLWRQLVASIHQHWSLSIMTCIGYLGKLHIWETILAISSVRRPHRLSRNGFLGWRASLRNSMGRIDHLFAWSWWILHIRSPIFRISVTQTRWSRRRPS